MPAWRSRPRLLRDPSTPVRLGVANLAAAATVSASADVGAEGAMPIIASIDFGAGRPSATTLATQYLGFGYQGFVEYIGPGTPTQWTGFAAFLKSNYQTTRIIPYQLTVRNTHSDSGLTSVLTNLPDSWRPYFRYNYFQEPEDDIAGNATALAAYKAVYTAAANTIRTWNTANPTKTVQLPWLELAEYSLYRQYIEGNPDRELSQFRPPLGDFQGVLWSLFEYQEIMNTTRLQAQIDRITTSMTDTFAGKPWGVMACCLNLDPVDNSNAGVGTYTATQKANQATWLTECYERCMEAGCDEWGWYNVKFGNGSGNVIGESRVEVIPETLAAFQALPRLNMTPFDPLELDHATFGRLDNNVVT